mmetsp:Transcript_19739/g.38995  ORF Transcript_19739/g.38995 Transcript_19739/m.38995 type:complete len:87 (+) Transcript_19739:184-444(+)
MRAVGGRLKVSTLASASTGLPSMYNVRTALRPSIERFGAWYVKRMWCQTPAGSGDMGKHVGSPLLLDEDKTQKRWLGISYQKEKKS